jgi:uncharacterized glyoxalase superfamily protein PhnB
VHESGQYAEMETGATTLAFVADELAAMNGPGYRENSPGAEPDGVEIVLVSADVEKAFEHAVKSGATPAKALETKPRGQTVGYVRDLDGMLVELATPMV